MHLDMSSLNPLPLLPPQQKSVRFSAPIITQVDHLPTGEDRTSPWEQLARDRDRFNRCIREFEDVMRALFRKHETKLGIVITTNK